MATTGAITIYLQDLEIIDAEVKRRVRAERGASFDIYDAAYRSELVRQRKDIIHEIVSNSCYAR